MDPQSDGPSRGGAAPDPTRPGQGGLADRGGDIFFDAIAATQMPMVLSDPNRPDNPIVFANRAFVRMTGYDRSEILGRNCRFLQGIDTDRDTVDQVRQAIRARTEIAVELLNYRKDGTAFWNALFVSPVFGADGRLVYFFASQLDVSRRRDAEDALRRAQAIEAAGQLTGGIAHEFNNLLQVITGHMDGIRRHAAASNDPRLVRQVGAVSEAADRATALTRQLLDLSRNQPSEGRTVNLNGIVAGVSETLKSRLGAGVAIETALADGVPNCRLDPSRCEAALVALVLDARNATPNVGSVRIETADVEVGPNPAPAMGSLAPGRYGTVAISLTGAGAVGAELDLSVIQRFARQSGGAVHLDGGVGRGAVVRLYVPAAAGGEPALRPDGPRGIDRGGGERVLVVDDRPEVAELARTMLDNLGYTVEVARDGRDALSKLAAGFDLLFTDLVMPGDVDGASLAREAQRLHPRLRVLLTTGYADPALALTDAAGEAFATIAKPYRRADLARRVRAVLDGSAGVS